MQDREPPILSYQELVRIQNNLTAATAILSMVTVGASAATEDPILRYLAILPCAATVVAGVITLHINGQVANYKKK